MSNTPNLPQPSSTEFAPSSGTYLFRDLSLEIQQRILRLQNTSGDFLKLKERGSLYWLTFLLLTLLGFALYIFIFVISKINFDIIFVLSVGICLFLLWMAYFAWRLFNSARWAIKNYIYLTPTQLIQTRDGFVRFCQLKDVAEIKFIASIRSTGRVRTVFYYLIFNYSDFSGNGSFKIYFSNGFTPARQAISGAKFWLGQAENWRNYAISADQRKDSAFFNSWNTFSGLSTVNTPAAKIKSGFLPVITLLGLTFSLPVLGIFSWALIGSKVEENKIWNYAVSKQTVTPYFFYLKKYLTGSHLEEARQKVSGFYDESVKSVKQNQAAAIDSKGVETALNLLENAKVGQDNTVNLTLKDESGSISEADFRLSLAATFAKMFPTETLLIEKDASQSAIMNVRLSSINVEILQPVKQSAIKNKTAKRNPRVDSANNLKTACTFQCAITVPGKPIYQFEMKDVTPDDFDNELIKRLGFKF